MFGIIVVICNFPLFGCIEFVLMFLRFDFPSYFYLFTILYSILVI